MTAAITVYSWSQEPRGFVEFKDFLRDSALRYYASQILDDLGYTDMSQFVHALQRACTILDTALIPVEDHIRSTFRGGPDQIYQDWKLSELALYLLKVNGNPKSEQVALYQLSIYSLLNPGLK